MSNTQNLSENTAQKVGKPLQNTTADSLKPTSIRLSLADRESVKELAQDEQRSFTNMLHVLIRDAIKLRHNSMCK